MLTSSGAASLFFLFGFAAGVCLCSLAWRRSRAMDGNSNPSRRSGDSLQPLADAQQSLADASRLQQARPADAHRRHTDLWGDDLDRPDVRSVLANPRGRAAGSRHPRAQPSTVGRPDPPAHLQDSSGVADIPDAHPLGVGHETKRSSSSRTATKILARLLSEHAIAEPEALAKLLIRELGSVREAFFTDPDILAHMGIDPRAISALQSFKEVHEHLLVEKLKGDRAPLSDNALKQYLRARLGALQTEHFHVIYLDGLGRFIRGVTHWEGTVEEVSVHVRTVALTALLCGATRIILAHNHPSGNAEPSEADTDITRLFSTALRWLDVRVADHWIIGRDTDVSFKKRGWL